MTSQFDIAPGTEFAGDYRIESALSAGGMGAVYVATQVSTGKSRALKVMLPTLVADPQLRKRFEQEARIASLIESEHVVETVGAGIDASSGMPWLAMELLSGEDLSKVVTARGALTSAEVLLVYEQLCHAVGAAHRVGVVHRDLKPENIFLAQARRAGATFTVKVLDFGIAKIVAEASTKQTAAMGSPIWMAPEQADQTSPITPASDVWALGLIAFYLLTGKSYWRSGNDDSATIPQVLKEVLFEPIMPVLARAAELGCPLPPAFEAWFARCVVRDPAARFADANEAGLALPAALTAAPAPLASIGFGVTALSTGPAPQSFAPMVPTQMGGAAVAVSGTANTAAYTVRSSHPPPMGATTPSRPPPSKPFPVLPVVAAASALLLILLVGVVFMRRGPSVTVATPTSAPSSSAAPASGDPVVLADAKKLVLDGKFDSAHQRLTSLPSDSDARHSAEFKEVESHWATETLLLADRTADVGQKRVLLQAVADCTTIDEAFRDTAKDRLAALDGKRAAADHPPDNEPPPPVNPPPTPQPAAAHAVAVVPTVVTPAQPVAPPPTVAPAAPAAPAQQYVDRDANQLASSNNPADWALVKSAIMPRVMAGQATPAEIKVLMKACKRAHDVGCMMTCKAAH